MGQFGDTTIPVHNIRAKAHNHHIMAAASWMFPRKLVADKLRTGLVLRPPRLIPIAWCCAPLFR